MFIIILKNRTVKEKHFPLTGERPPEGKWRNIEKVVNN